jgi:hypothetical protein
MADLGRKSNFDLGSFDLMRGPSLGHGRADLVNFEQAGRGVTQFATSIA